ncbi:uncharacterized protein MELLADRAFT_114541 [Melampsora larici-populina 98AG31]|uniref:FAR1 domain-containing protein n=1 Tax=Melampsora larici-populina (strain 98AG31 / pathotype 3-4-7) TaxID=747676 RepID=F4SDV9_MELLP|nr:uncharacterized protein MELLADRAFT_114541 [Melampsora larici-populina 98AG31]EGF97166.1 hypothetical protein MELLADRAFT_114541 [Melampsora larici-populina 98AG31]
MSSTNETPPINPTDTVINTTDTLTADTNINTTVPSTDTNTNPPSTTSLIPPPDAAGIFPTHTAIEHHLKSHGNTQRYPVSSLDSRDTFKTWKCGLGPNRKQEKAKRDDPTLIIPTCPFKATARRNPDDYTWYIRIDNPLHNHEPIPDFKPMALPNLSEDKIETKPKTKTTKRKRVDSLPAAPSQTQNTPTTSKPQNTSQYRHRFQALIQEMETLDEDVQNNLLDRFFRDCEVAKGAKTLKKGVRAPENPVLKSSPIRQPDVIEPEHCKETPVHQEASNKTHKSGVIAQHDDDLTDLDDSDQGNDNNEENKDNDDDEIAATLLTLNQRSNSNKDNIRHRATRSKNNKDLIKATRKSSRGNPQATDLTEINQNLPNPKRMKKSSTKSKEVEESSRTESRIKTTSRPNTPKAKKK